jgi:hypothetical protein
MLYKEVDDLYREGKEWLGILLSMWGKKDIQKKM